MKSIKLNFTYLNRLKTALFTTILLFTISGVVAQNGIIQGIVTTSDGKPADLITVSIPSQKLTILTNDKGVYHIGHLKEGNYEINVGAINLSTQTKNVTVTAGQTTVLNFVLDVNNTQLQEVVVQENNRRIKIDNPSPSLRLQAPLLEIPQNIQVVSQQSLREQQVISMSDGVIRNVSGATRIEHWGDLYTNITMRGSQIQAFRNGFNVVTSYWGPLTEDMSFVDHIEFVKGPAGFMLSNGDPAGLYNVVTKKPTGQNKGEFSLTTGSYGLFRSSIDMDGKLSKDGRLLYRLNVAGQNKGSFRPYEYNNRYSIAPVISYQADEKTKLTLEYTLQHANMSNLGSYYVFDAAGYATKPQSFTLSNAGLEPTKINDHSLFLNLQHQINSNWKLTAQAAYFNYGQVGSSMWPTSVNANSTLIRNVSIWDAKSEMTMAQAFLNGNIMTGAVRHRILGGVDISNKDYKADWLTGHDLDTPGSPFDLNAPNYGVPTNGYPQFDRSQSLEARAAISSGTMTQQYTGVYAQDELGFLNNTIRLTLAGRYTYVQQSEWGGAPYSGQRFTPRVGLSVSIDDHTSVYGLYDQAFIPQAGRVAIGMVKPITGSNTEFGIKRDWFGGKWNTTIAVYRIFKDNELTPDPFAPPASGLSVILGQKKAQGLEFDLRGQIAKGLSLTANYAFTDSKVTKVTQGVTGISVGDVVPGFAKHTFNGWLNYKITNGGLKGVGISGGVSGLLDRATDTWSVGLQKLPNYYKIDAGLFWEGSKMRITGNVFNIANKYLYSGSFYSYNNSYYWQAEAPRNYRLSVSYKF